MDNFLQFIIAKIVIFIKILLLFKDIENISNDIEFKPQ